MTELQKLLRQKTENNEPVLYCSHCHSLRILGVEDCEYCDNCGSTDIEKCSIFEYEERYKLAHSGINYLEEY